MDRFAIWLQRLPSAILHLPGIRNSQSPHCVIIIPILNLLGSHSDAVYLLSTLLCLFCTTITQCLIFVPKVTTRSYLVFAIEGRRQNQNCKKKVSNYSEFILWRDWIHFKWLNNLISSGMLRYTVPSTEKSGDGAWHVLYLQEVIRYRFKPVGTFHQVYFL